VDGCSKNPQQQLIGEWKNEDASSLVFSETRVVFMTPLGAMAGIGAH
jgi:hypothetical protein